MANPGSNPLSDATKDLNRSVALLTTGLNQLKELLGSVGKQVAGLVKTFDPSAFRLFEIAVTDANAALGRVLLPTLRQFTAVVRGIGDGIASLGPQAQTMIRALAAAAVAMTAVAGAAFIANLAINSALGGIPAILGLVAGGLTGLGFALKGVAEVQATVNAIMRPAVALFNEIGKAALGVFNALRPALSGLTGVIAGAIGQLAQLVANAAPGIARFATQLAALLQPLIAHFTAMAPVLFELIGTVLQLGQAIVGVQMQILGAVFQALLPLLPVVRQVVEVVATLARVFTAVLTPLLAAAGALVQVALIPLTVAFRVLGPILEQVARAVNAALQPLAVAFEEVGLIVGELAAQMGKALGDLFGSLAGLLPSVMPLLTVAVDVFVGAMTRVVQVIQFVADTIRALFGLEVRNRGGNRPVDDTFKPGASQGLGFREASRGGIEEFINKAQQSAFSAGGAQEDPAKQTATSAQNIDTKVGDLVTEVKELRQAFEQKIQAFLDKLGNVASAPGKAVRGAAESGAFGIGPALVSRMITG
jgi:phage-related protein